MDRKKDSDKQLDPPAAFGVPRSTDPRGLIPPSHFQSRSAPPLAVPAALPWSATPLSNWEATELKRENQRLKDELHRWRTKGEKLEEAGSRSRSLDREAESLNTCHTLAMSQQAEIISHQLHEIQRLEAELSTLRVASAQQEAMAASRENAFVNLQGELTELKSRSQAEAVTLKTELEEVKKGSTLETEALRKELEELRTQSKLEADSLREELELTKERHGRELGLARGELQGVVEEAEAGRKRQEERAQECLQTVLRQHQVELSRLSEVHGAEVASLKHQVCLLQQDLETHHKETVQLREDRDVLQSQLSLAEAELASQNALVLQLKTYVGEQEAREPSSEQEQLRSRVQQLEDEKDALKITAELLQVRLASLNDILTLQETELSKKVQLQDPLQPESSQKLQGLLTRWREKVFSLLVQLKSQELSHRNTTKQLDWKTLQAEALHSKKLAQKHQQRAEAAESALKGLGDFVSRLSQQLLGQEETWKSALSRLAGLGNRVAFAAKRVDTIQEESVHKQLVPKVIFFLSRIQPSYEDLQAELQMLHEERDQLSMELKRGAQLIERKVAEAKEKVESDLQEMREKSRSLQDALEAKAVVEQALRQQQEDTERQLEKVCQDLQKSEEAVENLKHELGQMREEYERALQEKVTEVETQLRKDLSEMEKCLNDARREHTKAVVALRQAERQAVRDKARSEELAKLQESATQQEIARLEKRMRELERDKNLLMATLKQEGLLAQHRQNRRLAIRGPEESTGRTGLKSPSKGTETFPQNSCC
ncbi:hypothetical protein JD844_013453 [Phrynosoma platyrhinos]|uniref:Coiled-coil alpha-helical rod protein 1 n=1 Tax=Phrynosoma platyrhinos TaxID=52577 RepID=A0ABQ7TL45_PHRPL|nr:hypothetical protein JD844_013453 [Phrynosoma platyrhinos]